MEIKNKGQFKALPFNKSIFKNVTNEPKKLKTFQFSSKAKFERNSCPPVAKARPNSAKSFIFDKQHKQVIFEKLIAAKNDF